MLFSEAGFHENPKIYIIVIGLEERLKKRNSVECLLDFSKISHLLLGTPIPTESAEFSAPDDFDLSKPPGVIFTYQ